VNFPTEEGYIDLQVNGYAGVDFNADDLQPDDLHRACQALRADGVAAILATVITEDLTVMCRRLARLVALRDADPLAAQLIAGLHIEGPFINEQDGYRGAHPRDAVRPADLDAAQRLLEAAGGLTRLVTLSPERDPGCRVTRFLARSPIRVSAGHCDPTLDQLRAAIDAGLTLFTHLGNGCPALLPRHDNIIQRALALSDRLTLCFIADGIHVPLVALRNYLRCAGIDRCAVVSDAMAAAGLGPGRYRLSRWEVTVGDDQAARSPDGSHLVGAAMPLRRARQNLRDSLGLTDAECQSLMVDTPAAMLQSAGGSVQG
jgi:N-acetylglucosamine-6-phosphate deacetylase